jgi:hypothetical protein
MTALGLTLAACAEDLPCDATSALPVVSVDVAVFDAAHDLDTLEVCMDGQCAHPGESTDPLLFPQEAQARFLAPADGTGDVVRDDAPAVTLLVRTEAGEILIPETVVELSLVYPNGEECGGGAFQGWFEATADGSIIDVAAT